jgi:hypothetical protein
MNVVHVPFKGYETGTGEAREVLVELEAHRVTPGWK